ncbi:MAG: cell division protein ZapE [Gammaproteobacteria bacterium]
MLKKILRKASSTSPESSPQIPGILERQYYHQVELKRIQFDEAQLKALRRLQKLLDCLIADWDYQNKPAAQKMLTPRPEKPRSLYLYGGVGRGKSMLMEWFYEACPITQKRRVHFNTFMLEVHAYTHQCRQRNEAGALFSLAGKIRQTTQLLCFDEFHVTDIADAMILGRLFGNLFKLGVAVVITSNRHPNDLYRGGVLREQFLFFIKVLKEAADIIKLDAHRDFRLQHLRALKTTYYFPLDQKGGEFIKNSYIELTNTDASEPKILSVLGRTIHLTAVHGDVACSTFEELCVQPLGAADYWLIANEFSALILADIPRLTTANRNEAKRFVTLIDALYEHKVKLICTAEVPAHELYTEGDGAFEFERTVSRLIEMQSDSYLKAEHITAGPDR